jgi:hypothetical protein
MSGGEQSSDAGDDVMSFLDSRKKSSLSFISEN